MASILFLPEECLFKIVSYICDPCTFYNIALTCKRFLQVTRNTRNVLHARLLLKKAMYFIDHYKVEIDDDEDEDCKLRKLVHDSMQLTKAKELFTYEKVIDAWQRNGPVAAKLLTWVRNRETGYEGSLCGTRYSTVVYWNQTLMLYLPSSGKNMVIEVNYNEDFVVIYDSKLTRIHVTCEELDVKCQHSVYCCSSTPDSPDSSDGRSDNRFLDCDVVDTDNLKPLKPVIKLLQEELGETVPPITNYFFIWLCYFFPNKLNLNEENKLVFKDTVKNAKPTFASVQPAIDEYHKVQQIETNFQKLFSEWETDEKQESNHAKMVAETIRLLAQRSEIGSLEHLDWCYCEDIEIDFS